MPDNVETESPGIEVVYTARDAADATRDAAGDRRDAAEAARDAAYIAACAGLGVAKLGEEAYKAVKTFESKALGDEEGAVKTAESDTVEHVAEKLGDELDVSDEVRAVGAHAEAVGEFVGGIGAAVAAAALIPEGAGAVAAGVGLNALVALDVSGELLENAAADGKITNKETAAAAGGGIGMAALGVAAGEAAAAVLEEIESGVAAIGVGAAVEDVAEAAEETVAKETAESAAESAGKSAAKSVADEGSEAAVKKAAEKAGTETFASATEKAATKAATKAGETVHRNTLSDIPLLVNQDHPLPDGYVPELTKISGNPDIHCDRRCEQALAQFVAAAQDAGFHPEIKSAYRDEKAQNGCFARKLEQYWNHGVTLEEALAKTRRYVAAPGTSEHQTGLAADIKDADYTGLVAELNAAPGQKWLIAHCHEFGFILRYPSDKESITHVAFEPCHFRYVGKSHAAEIVRRGITLEEHISNLENSTSAKEQR